SYTMATIAVTLSFALLLFMSCEKLEKDVKLVSAKFGEASHNTGDNCMSCHTNAGDVEGWFVIAGTVYDKTGSTTDANGDVKIFTGQNGTGKQMDNIEVDALGNFYTTHFLSFEDGLYPAVFLTSGDTKFMTNKVYTGNCNSCHGVGNTPKIGQE
ncbi:hypothetical protein ACFL6I_27855, partial [candidate division KSB1 bacterium]